MHFNKTLTFQPYKDKRYKMRLNAKKPQNYYAYITNRQKKTPTGGLEGY